MDPLFITSANALLVLVIAWILVQTCFKVFRNGASSDQKLPPGPKPFPIIGNILDLGDKPHKSLAKLAKIHGPLMSLQLGQITTIVASSSTVAKQILRDQDLSFANRHILDATRACGHDQVSVVWLPVSPKWITLRRICNSNIFSGQKLDVNRHLRQQKVQQVISEIHDSCCSATGHEVAIDFGEAAFKASLCVLSNTLVSADLADPNRSAEVREFREIVVRIMEEIGKPNVVDYFPVLTFIDPQGIRRRSSALFIKMETIINMSIEQRLKARSDENGFHSGNDVLDTLLDLSEEDDSNSNNDGLDRNVILHLLLDLFVAGTDTTASTLEWAMAEILHNPSVLSEVKSELENTIGRGKPIQESDVSRLPYLQAIVKETFRLHPPVPFLIPRKVNEKVQLLGYTIPKDSQVLVNAWAIGRDPDVWSSPECFMPERFLGMETDVKGRDFELIPFGAGRRICPGLPLATRMIHLLLGSLLNSFHWKLEDGVEPHDMDMDDKFGITLRKSHPLMTIPIPL